uniref:Protein kinase domain-containing protein n=1 Tax=Euplotes harpa TaxID=151035 RepID=A0A7S3JKZ1_9SPIT
MIGSGGSSKVFSAFDSNKNLYAIKAIRKDKGYASEMESMIVLREYFVMEHIGEHPNIIKHYSCNPEGMIVHNDVQQPICYNVMEYCANGSLSTIVRNTGAIEESIARFMFVQLASAVQFLHEKKFAHLDIKLENILLDEWFNIKLADFGSGVSLVKTRGMTANRVGTPLYMPPEIKNLEKGQSFEGMKADIYSFGVTLCLMLFGELPDFSMFDCDASTIGTNQMSSDDFMDVEMSEEKLSQRWKYLSASSKDLIQRMTNEDPNKRPTIEEVLAHEWVYFESLDGLQSQVYLEMKARQQAISNFQSL